MSTHPMPHFHCNELLCSHIRLTRTLSCVFRYFVAQDPCPRSSLFEMYSNCSWFLNFGASYESYIHEQLSYVVYYSNARILLRQSSAYFMCDTTSYYSLSVKALEGGSLHCYDAEIITCIILSYRFLFVRSVDRFRLLRYESRLWYFDYVHNKLEMLLLV